MEKDRKTWRPTRTVRRNRGYLKVPGRVRIFGHTGSLYDFEGHEYHRTRVGDLEQDLPPLWRLKLGPRNS